MADADDVRQLALALPDVAEIESEGKPRLIRTDIAVLFVGDEAEKQALLLGEPDVFFSAPGYDGLPLVMLRLAAVDVERLGELVTDAWRMRAPDVLVGNLEETEDMPRADLG